MLKMSVMRSLVMLLVLTLAGASLSGCGQSGKDRAVAKSAVSGEELRQRAILQSDR